MCLCVSVLSGSVILSVQHLNPAVQDCRHGCDQNKTAKQKDNTVESIQESNPSLQRVENKSKFHILVKTHRPPSV